MTANSKFGGIQRKFGLGIGSMTLCREWWFLLKFKGCVHDGEMAERFKAHAWKACVG